MSGKATRHWDKPPGSVLAEQAAAPVLSLQSAWVPRPSLAKGMAGHHGSMQGL